MDRCVAIMMTCPPIRNSFFDLQVGLCFYAAIALGFSNNAETPATLQSRGVVYKQTAAGFYTPFAWITCVVLASLPVAIVADVIFGSLLYWITKFVPEVDNFLFFLMTLFFMDVLLAAIFRLMMVRHHVLIMTLMSHDDESSC